MLPLSQKGGNGEIICMTRLINLQNPLGKDPFLPNLQFLFCSVRCLVPELPELVQDAWFTFF